MKSKKLVETWFEKWEDGDFKNIPIEKDFRHTSPYGTVEGRDTYLGIVEANKSSFLGHRFELHDGIYEEDRACVRYTSTKGDFQLDVSEWFYLGDDKISEIVSYYNVGDVSYDETLNQAE